MGAGETAGSTAARGVRVGFDENGRVTRRRPFGRESKSETAPAARSLEANDVGGDEHSSDGRRHEADRTRLPIGSLRTSAAENDPASQSLGSLERPVRALAAVFGPLTSTRPDPSTVTEQPA